MSNTFGHLFKVTTFGESHGPSIGVVIDGCPPNLPLSIEDIQHHLNRRKTGQSSITSQRNESTDIQILSGLFEGKTLGTPIAIIIPNQDARKEDYTDITQKFRPSHADFTYQAKFGIRDPFGGGRSSARETASRVAAGAIAQKILQLSHNIQIVAYVDSIHTLSLPREWNQPVTQTSIDTSVVRCPDSDLSRKMTELIESTKQSGDSLGGTITCRIQNVPQGLGNPVFDRLEANLAKAMLSIPATKGFEIGSGFYGATHLIGSQHNDPFISASDSSKHPLKNIQTTTNHSGGIQGGISNGMEIYFRVAFKPTATIAQQQQTIDTHGNPTTIQPSGRHDPCVLPRAVPIVEAMSALVLLDHLMLHNAQCSSFSFPQSLHPALH
jgi:chorismate synthase